eukprot:1145666-Pelagomonas_calceolata.AAC.6
MSGCVLAQHRRALPGDTAWRPLTSLPAACDLCDAQDDVQDEQHVLFKCTHPHVCSLRLKYASLFSGPLLSLSHSSKSVAPYVPGIHHVQLAVNRFDWRPSFSLT